MTTKTRDALFRLKLPSDLVAASGLSCLKRINNNSTFLDALPYFVCESLEHIVGLPPSGKSDMNDNSVTYQVNDRRPRFPEICSVSNRAERGEEVTVGSRQGARTLSNARAEQASHECAQGISRMSLCPRQWFRDPIMGVHGELFALNQSSSSRTLSGSG